MKVAPEKSQSIGLIVQILILATLFIFAVAQPILDLLGRHPEFFIAREAQDFDPVWLAVILCVFAPLSISLLLVLLHRLASKLAHGFFYLSGSLLLSMIVLQLIMHIESVSGQALIISALILGVISAWLIYKFSFIQRFISLCAIAIIVVPINFLFFTDVIKVVFPEPQKREVTVHAPKSSLPIVFLVFDALPLKSLLNDERQIDRALFPGFAELAQRSTWYRNATTVSFETLTAVPAVLSGMLPNARRLPTISDYPQNLFTLLSPTYKFFAYEPYTQLCPDKLCDDLRAQPSFHERVLSLFDDVAIVYMHLLLPVDITQHLPSITTDWKHFAVRGSRGSPSSGSNAKASQTSVPKGRSKVAAMGQDNFVELFDLNLRNMKAGSQGSLYFQHLLLPHIPWRYLPSGKQYLLSHDLGIERTGKWVTDKELVKREYHRHILQLIFVDSLIEKLLRRLDETALFDQALIIVTADHGASFRPGEYKRRAGTSNLLDIASIPLFIKYPEQKSGEVSDLLAQTIDLLPTVAEVVGAELSSGSEGLSLKSDSITEREQVQVFHLPRKFEFNQSQIASNDLDMDLLKIKNQMADNWYKLDPHADLSGVAEPKKVVRSKNIEAKIINRTAYESVDLNTPFVPARVMGSIKGREAKSSLSIAIGLNGYIAATTETYSNDAGDVRFSAMLSPEYFRNGNNKIHIYLIDDANERLTNLLLVPLAGETKYRLVNSGDGELIVERGDQRFEVMPTSRKNPVRGYVDNAVRGHQITSITGWGADSRAQGEQVEILLFNGEEFLASTQTNSVRVDVAKAFSIPRLKYAGFGFRIPSSLLPEPGAGRLRLFIMTNDGVATELVYDKNYPWRG